MRVCQISAGAGDSFYCENCLRDNALVREMYRSGLDVSIVPLYLPPVHEFDDDIQANPVFFGGINVFLQQKLGLFRKTPRWLDKLFDSPRLLKWAASKAGMTRARDLGETTLSMLRGEEGRQVKELDRLVTFLELPENKPDIVCLSNSLLVGVAREIRRRLSVPVIVTLQDEDAFLDSLPDPYKTQAWETLRERIAEVQAIVTTCSYFADVMTRRLQLDPDRVHVIHNGIVTKGYEPPPSPPDPQAIGFLSPMIHGKGLDILVEAYGILRREMGHERLKLKLSGGMLAGQEGFLEDIKHQVHQAGWSDDIEIFERFDRPAKREFFRSLTVLSVPTRQPEASGLYILEGLACGVPSVQPNHGSFPEILELTGGGLLCKPNDPRSLAETIHELLTDESKRAHLASLGRQKVLSEFTMERASGQFMDLLDEVHRKETA